MPDQDAEAAATLAAAIEPWLTHMRWRADFDAWRERRIRQEDYQEANLRDIEAALGMSQEGTTAGKRVLDLGSGMGGLSVALLRRWGKSVAGAGLHLQAADYNQDYCRIARLRAQRYGIHLPLTVAAGEQLPYPGEAFDLVLCLDVLEHVRDAGQVLSEIHRVLKPGGLVLTTVPNRHAFRDPHYHLPFINWLPRLWAERLLGMLGRSKQGLLQDRQALSELNTYSWAGFVCLARGKGFRVRDQVRYRIMRGEIRQLRGWRLALLRLLVKLGLADLLYRLYRYGWQGTYQIMLAKPR